MSDTQSDVVEHDYSKFTADENQLVASSNIGAAIVQKALDQLAAEARVVSLEEQLAEAKAALRVIQEQELPDLMDAAGSTEFKSQDGMKVKLGEVVRGSIPKANEAKAFEWLEESGNAGLIKRNFIIDFSRDEESWARKFERDLARRKKALNVAIKRAVNAQTLQAFVRQRLQAGEEIPMDLLGVYRQRLTKVTVPD